MDNAPTQAPPLPPRPAAPAIPAAPPGQVVLVLQGGGALGAYQAGVYQALHEAGIEPDWVIGTSIGAINGALIAGNPPAQRLERLRAFWQEVGRATGAGLGQPCAPLGDAFKHLMTMATGIPAFFTPNLLALLGQHAPLGVEQAAYYSTAALRGTLGKLVDFDYLAASHTRLALGAVNVASGAMTYFDSRREPLGMEHVMASGALPPAFPAVRVKDEFYWDGGIYSNTPLEAVLDDNPRRNSLIFTVDLWNPNGPLPETLWQVAGKAKDIQYASRAHSHLARQKDIHHLRHVILELARALPDEARQSDVIKELMAWGCKTTMHVARLIASDIGREDWLKDIDFTPAQVDARWRAGYAATRRMLAAAPWTRPVAPTEGIVIHDLPAEPAL